MISGGGSVGKLSFFEVSGDSSAGEIEFVEEPLLNGALVASGL